MPLIISVVIGLLLAMTAGIVHLPPVRQFVLKQGEDYLRTSQQLDVQAGSLSYNLFGMSATLRDVTVRATGDPQAPPLLEATRVYIDLDATGLLRGKFAVDGAELEGVRLHLAADENGRWNIPETTDESRGPPEIPEILIDSLTASGTELTVEDAQNDVSVRLGQWRLSIDGQPGTLEHAIRFSIPQAGEAIFEQRQLLLNELALQLAWRGEQLQVRNARVRLGGSSVTVAGRIDNLLDPVARLGVDSQLAVGELARFAAEMEDVDGSVTIHGNLSDSLTAPRFTGSVTGSELSYGQYQGVNLAVIPVWDPGSKILALNSLNVTSPYGSLEGQASLATESGDSSLQATFAQLDLGSVTRLMDAGISIASSGSGSVTASWPVLSFEEATGTADVRLVPRGQPSENVLPVAARLSVDAETGRVRVQVSSLETLEASATGEVVIENQSGLSGTMSVNAGDLSQTVAEAFVFLGREPLEQELGGGVRLTANLGGTLDSPRATAEIEGDQLSVGEIRDVALRAGAEYVPDQLTLNEATLAWEGQEISASGVIGLAGDSPVLDLEVSGEEITIGPVLDALGQELPVGGIASFFADVTGTANDPLAQVRLSGENLVAYGEQWGALSTEASFSGGRVDLSELRLEKPGSEPLTASGSYELETEQYRIRAETDALTLNGLEIPDGDTVTGRIGFSASGEGVVSNPSGSVNASIANLVVGERRLGAMDLSADIADRLAVVSLSAPRVGVEADARVATEAPYQGEFEVTATLDDLERFAIPGPDGELITGAIHGVISGAGELANWRALDADAKLDELRLVVNQQEIRAADTIEARLQNRVLHFEPAEILAGDAKLRMEGALPLDEAAVATGEFQLDAEGSVASFLAFVPADLEELQVEGTVTANARLRGSIERPDPTLSVTLRNGAISPPGVEQRLTGIELDAATREGILSVDRLAGQWSGATLSANASVPPQLISDVFPAPPSGPTPARFRAEVSDLNLASIEGAPEGIQGTVHLLAEGESPTLELSDATAEAWFDQLRLKLGEVSLDQAAPVRFSMANSRITIDSFDLQDGDTRITAMGTAQLDGDQKLDLQLAARTDASLLSSLTPGVRATGLTQFMMAVGGTLSEPAPAGVLQLQGGRIAMDNPRLQGENLDLWVRVTPGLVEVLEGTGEINGGDLGASGTLAYSGNEITNLDLGLNLDGLFLEFPQGLRTLSDTNIKISQGDNDQILVSGRIQVTEGSFRDELDPAGILNSRGGVEFVEDRDPLLSRIRFGIDIDTASPIIIDNELAQLTVTSDLVLTGTYYRPGLTGRLRIDEGGKIRLAEHEYVVDTGIIDFVNENEIQPSFNILARTRARGEDIDLRITGSPDNLDTSFTAPNKPEMSEPDIMSLLLTGKTLEEARGSELNIARDQAMSYLTGQLGGRFSTAAEEALGITQVRIEPNLISAESNPGARLTIGEDLRPDLRLIYSMNLVDSSDQILIGEYDLTRRFNIRGTNQSDNTRRIDVQHDLSFGGNRTNTGGQQETRRVGDIAFIGNTVFSGEELQGRLEIKAGQRYDFFRLRRGLDRIENLYRRNEYLEATVRLGQQRNPQTVDVTVNVDAGPAVTFVFEGYGAPSGLRNRVRDIWASGVFDTQRGSEAVTEIRRHLAREGYIDAEVSYTISSPDEGTKRVLFEVLLGNHYGDVNLVFEGADAVGADQLMQVVRAESDGIVNSILTPQPVVDVLNQYLRQQGYLSARVGLPHRDAVAETGRADIVFPIDEGPLFRIGDVVFEGNRALSREDLLAVVIVYSGDAYQPERLEISIERLEEAYWQRGYNDVTIRSLANTQPEAARVNVRFVIDEQRQDVVQQIEVAGNNDVSDKFVRSLVRLDVGDILDYRRTERSRRALYKTGAFSLVELETEPVGGTTAEEDPYIQQLMLRARVREVVPYSLRYGGFYDTDRGWGFIFDFENRNSLLGGARLVGVRGRYDSDLHELRGFFGQPFSFRFPSILSATTFARREFKETFITDRIGFSLQHELELREDLIFSYGYRFERAHTYELDPDPFLPFDETLNIAPLTTSLSWDTRDELLDATRGFFTSHGLEYAPSLLGSDLRYIKYLGQYFRYFPLTEPDEVPFGQGRKRPRVVYAVGGRVGLARGFGGQSVIPSERFFSGGGTTVRGFKQDSIGPTDYFGDPEGGEAMLVVNNELRFPVFKFIEGVSFVDIGNVYPRASDFNPFDVRSSAGPGLRVRTPYFLLRFDYGFKLDRQPGESKGEFFFSIGQAF